MPPRVYFTCISCPRLLLCFAFVCCCSIIYPRVIIKYVLYVCSDALPRLPYFALFPLSRYSLLVAVEPVVYYFSLDKPYVLSFVFGR